MYSITRATTKIAKLKRRLRCVQGGSSAGKTIGILEVLIHLAQTDKTPTVTSVVSESFPHLRRGAMRDFLDILEKQGYYKDDRFSKTDSTYTFETGSKIEFFSADQPGKVRGPRRDRLFVNEANHIDYETFTQLEIRTKDFIFIDWNPTSPGFWFYENIEGKRDDYDFIILNYLDNGALSPEIIKAIDSRKTNVNWYKVYGLGQLGEVEGLVYTGWKPIDAIPPEARLVSRGLDFGFSPDPAAIVDVWKWNDAYIFDEVLYQRGLQNPELAQVLKNLPVKVTYADCAEPKSIAELNSYGVSAIAVKKGKDSKKWGIGILQNQTIFYTKRSINLAKEYRSYMLATDADGHFIPGETVGEDHALDAARYGLTSVETVIRQDEFFKSLPTIYSKPKANPAR